MDWLSTDIIGPFDKSVEGHHYGLVARHTQDLNDEGDTTNGSNFLIILGMTNQGWSTECSFDRMQFWLHQSSRSTKTHSQWQCSWMQFRGNTANIQNVQYHSYDDNSLQRKTIGTWLPDMRHTLPTRSACALPRNTQCGRNTTRRSRTSWQTTRLEH